MGILLRTHKMLPFHNIAAGMIAGGILIPCIGSLVRGKIRSVIRSGVLPVKSIVLTNLPLLQAAGFFASGFFMQKVGTQQFVECLFLFSHLLYS